MNGFTAVVWREMLVLKSRLWRTLAGYGVSPALFLIAFGWGVGRQVSFSGADYLSFMVPPALVALSTMSHSFSLATDINVARFYTMTFEELQTAPISGLTITLAEVFAGVVRGVLATLVVMIIALICGVELSVGPLFVLSVLLNCFTFASLAVLMAMVVRSHADQASLTSFIIVPMSFLCGTFFPLERLPHWAGAFANLLPLTHASQCIRAAALGWDFPWLNLLILALMGTVFLAAASFAVRRASV